MSNDNNKLLLSALGAAVAGAGVAVATMKLFEKRKEAPTHPPLKRNRTSFIYEDDMNSSSRTLIFPHNHEAKMARQIAARAAVEEENSIHRNSVTVRVPATSANMGPGCESKNARERFVLSKDYSHILFQMIRSD